MNYMALTNIIACKIHNIIIFYLIKYYNYTFFQQSCIICTLLFMSSLLSTTSSEPLL